VKEMDNKQAGNQREERGEQIPRSEAKEGNGALEELGKALEEEKKRSEGYLSRLQYMQADFQNLQKRLDRQLDEVKKYGSERLILELLGVVDELEAAVRESRQTKSLDALLRGVEMTLGRLMKILEHEDVSPIDCLGQAFDPAKHEAVAKVESDEDGKIIEEIRKGYTMKGKVIRPCAVKITVKPPARTTSEGKSDEQ
jgi:molecular chaperone GrpE